MALSKEPDYRHGSLPRTGILLVNLGTPDAPTAGAVRVYLKEFLSDPRVVEIPRLIWWLILNVLILPIRSSKSAAKYASIWSAEGSPLKVYTEKQAKLLRGLMGQRGHAVLVEYGMRYGNPSIASAMDRLKADGAERVLILPLYPQYSGTTTASSFDAVQNWCARTRNLPELRFVKHYHDDPLYIAALAQRIRDYWEKNGYNVWPTGGERKHAADARLVMSFHGVPKRTLLLGDPYHCECLKTGRLLSDALGLAPEQVLVSFQSRFGKAEWLQPYTAPSLQQLARDGATKVDICCPGFPADCLETLEEIAMEGKVEFQQAGGKEYRYIPCLNDHPAWIEALAQIAERHMQGWDTGKPDAAAEQEATASQQRALERGAVV